MRDCTDSPVFSQTWPSAGQYLFQGRTFGIREVHVALGLGEPSPQSLTSAVENPFEFEVEYPNWSGPRADYELGVVFGERNRCR